MTFTRGELYAYLAEHTQVVGEAGIFYSEEGFFETIVDGERIKGDWVTRDEGTVCREVSGQKDACETYYHNGDVVSIVTGEQTSLAPNLVEGNTVVVKELYTKEQTLELVAGKTVVWDPNGGGYYAPDGRLYTLWDGERETAGDPGAPLRRRSEFAVTLDRCVCGKQAAADLGPCGVGVVSIDQAALEVVVELLELVAIDFNVVS